MGWPLLSAPLSPSATVYNLSTDQRGDRLCQVSVTAPHPPQPVTRQIMMRAVHTHTVQRSRSKAPLADSRLDGLVTMEELRGDVMGAHVLDANMEEGGIKTYPTASHQGATETMQLHF
ncbi:unnamed protein product [Pleuronectes platessa]|uniref:Uncharacterized protein n=1 Tax=Pleuronectes platessa TaxID=8262 RepID=A0A9N7Y8G2_PLEPL|nr:unnamed protein product [Pleuronectes platessa]